MFVFEFSDLFLYSLVRMCVFPSAVGGSNGSGVGAPFPPLQVGGTVVGGHHMAPPAPNVGSA